MSRTFSLIFIVFLSILHKQTYCQQWCGANDKKILSFSANLSKSQKKASVKYVKRIPVVFHIIHDNGPENIPDSLIYQQLAILNEDFRKLPGTPGFGAGVDTEIEFCLATIDTAGNPTTGITRTQTPCTDASAADSCKYPGKIIDWGNLGTSRYLNFYIRRSLEGGKSGWGGSFGAEVRYDWIGRNSGGRVGTHEVGHFLSLGHTFNGGCGASDCANSGDYICDTPPVIGPGSCPPSGINSCTNDVPDLPDQVENYMDYSINCANMFTQGQKERMHSRLSAGSFYPNLVSYSNLQKTGCDPCSSACKPIADFIANKTVVSMDEKVSFTDLSYFGPTSWKWLFPGGNPSSDTAQFPSVTYDSVGTYNITLIATNVAGSDTTIRQGYITVMGFQWRGLGKGATGRVSHITVYNNELYAGSSYYGFITSANDTIKYIAKWNGSDWYPLDTAVNSEVYSMYVYKNELYVGMGDRLAKWNGSSWSLIFSGLQGRSYAMVEYKNELYFISDALYKWDGTLISLVATIQPTRSGLGLGVYKNELYMTGGITKVNNLTVTQTAKYDGTTWYSIGGSGLFDWFLSQFSPSGLGLVLTEFDTMLYLGGEFDSCNGLATGGIARWDGLNWYPVGQCMKVSSSQNDVRAMAIWDNKLHVGGSFYKPNTGCANGIASWDGALWRELGSGLGPVYALAVWNNELYAGGWFITGDDTAKYIAKWACSLNTEFTQSRDTADLAVSGAVQFTDKSAKAVQWLWNFGDGGTDTTQNPVHIYSDTGTYKVTLSASNGTCLSADSSVVVVKWDCYPLSIDYQQSMDTIDIALAPDTVTFTSQTFFTDSILWNFGDGAKDTAQNPTHIYPTVMGIYNVSLTGYMDTCSNFATSKVIICSKPKAIFAKNKDTVDLAVSGAVQFTNTSSNSYLWNWDFGDATTATALNPAHTYSQTGTFTVTLSASDSVCVNNATTTVVVVNTSGISKSENALQYKISPNPTAGAFTLALSIPDKQDLFISVTNILGQEVFSEKLMQVFGAYQKEMDLGNVPKGFYILRIRGERDVAVAKVVVQ